MARFTATPSVVGYGISETDAEGVGGSGFCVFAQPQSSSKYHAMTEQAARVLCLALSLDGGLDRALELLRSEAVRQNT